MKHKHKSCSNMLPFSVQRIKWGWLKWTKWRVACISIALAQYNWREISRSWAILSFVALMNLKNITKLEPNSAEHFIDEWKAIDTKCAMNTFRAWMKYGGGNCQKTWSFGADSSWKTSQDYGRKVWCRRSMCTSKIGYQTS